MNQTEESPDCRLLRAVLDTIFDNALDGMIFALDQDGRYLAFNGRHCSEMLRVWKADIRVGDSIFDHLSLPGPRDELRRSMERALSGEAFSEVREQTGTESLHDFRWKPIRMESGDMVGVLVIVADLTVKARQRKTIEKLTRLVEEAQDLAGMGGWEYEVSTGQVNWTPGMYQVYGVGPEFDPNNPEHCISFYKPDSAAKLTAAFTRIVESGEPYDLELQLERDDGRTIWVRTVGRATFKDGQVIRVSGDSIDIDKLKRAELEALELNAKLEQRVHDRTAMLKEKNKDLESFTRAISHELKAPLRAIAGFSRMVVEDCQDRLDAEGQRKLAVVYDNATTLDRLLSEILALARLGLSRLSWSRIDMKSMALAMYHEVASPEDLAEVALELAELPDCVGDPTLMRRVWGRLLDNALKFSAGRTGQKICIYAESSGLEHSYYVKDNGVGFNPASKEKLFMPFERLHPRGAFKGIGAGLATVKRIVELHHGSVGADCEEGRGAVFWFSLPHSGAPKNGDTANEI